MNMAAHTTCCARLITSAIGMCNWSCKPRLTLSVEGNLLLAGVTGSGKSVLMDLVMTVLVGTDVAHQHFNRSATGSKSDRTLKSYCLLDTKREENGLPQYQRDKGAITYIALEFTWPAKTGEEPRVETWGLRVEFRNAAENHGHIRAFFCDGFDASCGLCFSVFFFFGRKFGIRLGFFRRFHGEPTQRHSEFLGRKFKNGTRLYQLAQRVLHRILVVF